MNPLAMATVGFPANYPYASSQPLPSAVLRPLQQPLYDTELLTGAITEMIYFARQTGQTVNAGTMVKTAAETNLQQAGQLANPLEFSLFGFLFEIQPGTTVNDFNAIYTTGVFTFTYTGNRVYLQIPLTRIPQGVSPEGFCCGTGFTSPTLSGQIHNGVGHISNQYKFTIGRAALRIRPTESFNVRLTWPQTGGLIGPTSVALIGVTNSLVANSIRARVFLLGILWSAL